LKLCSLSIALTLLFSTSAFAVDQACEPITIFAAASTTNAIETAAADYERETACSVTTVFAASGTLARQIGAGAPADIFLSADPQWITWLEQSGKVRARNRIDLLGNDLVLITPQDADTTRLEITRADSLSAYLNGGRLAIGDTASVPAGRYASEALRRLGMSEILENQTVRAASVRVALAWVARGEAPAGIVYRTDATIEDGVRIAGVFPASPAHPIVYPLALIGRVPNEAAKAFYDYLQSYPAAVTFSDHGFRRITTQ